jgi:Subtilase family
VAAVSSAGSVAGFSSDNLSVEVAAPGVNISAQGRDGQYWLVTGTSPACALVAGVAALIKARYPSLAPDLLAKALTSTTHYRPDGGYDQKVGFGTVNASAALIAAGRLARQRAAQTGTAASTNFGGGPSAAPASPVGPRGTGQLILFAVLALTALVLVAASVSRLAVLKQLRRRTLTAASVPVAGSSFGRPPPTSPPLPTSAGPPTSARPSTAAQPSTLASPPTSARPPTSGPPFTSAAPPTSPQPGRHHASHRSTPPQQPPLPQPPPPQAPPRSYAQPAPQGPSTSYSPPSPHPQPAPHAHPAPQEPYPPQEPPVAYDSYEAHELYESQATRPLAVPQEQRRPQGWWPPPEADD